MLPSFNNGFPKRGLIIAVVNEPNFLWFFNTFPGEAFVLSEGFFNKKILA